MNPSEKHILEIDSVELSFGDRRILSGVYLAVETGGVTAVLGRNGCGKSCLMKILCGSLRADFRSMRIDGVWHDRFRADEVRYLAQQGFIPGWLTVDHLDVSVQAVPRVHLFDSMHADRVLLCRVSPFGDSGIIAYVQLPQTYRSLSRPSSAPDAKAFPLRSY